MSVLSIVGFVFIMLFGFFAIKQVVERGIDDNKANCDVTLAIVFGFIAAFVYMIDLIGCEAIAKTEFKYIESSETVETLSIVSVSEGDNVICGKLDSNLYTFIAQADNSEYYEIKVGSDFVKMCDLNEGKEPYIEVYNAEVVMKKYYNENDLTGIFKPLWGEMEVVVLDNETYTSDKQIYKVYIPDKSINFIS